MPPVKTKGGIQKLEPYPLNRYPDDVVVCLAKKLVHLMATGHDDLRGDFLSKIFADSIGGTASKKREGLADVSWHGCGFSIKTVSNPNPFNADTIRLISGRNAPIFSAGISDPLQDVDRTGEVVLEIYNDRINTALASHGDLRLAVLVRNWKEREFLLFERPIIPFAPNNYTWKVKANGVFEGYENTRHAFSWQPTGGQFSIIEKIPAGVTKFRINKEPKVLTIEQILDTVGFDDEWVEIL